MSSLPVSCDGRHSFRIEDVGDGKKLVCRRCDEQFVSVRLERVGDKLRIADPKKYSKDPKVQQ